jgi:hypothetical protein
MTTLFSWRYCRHTVIVGLFVQQVVALFILKSGAGFSIFNWIAALAGDFLNEALVGATVCFTGFLLMLKLDKF